MNNMTVPTIEQQPIAHISESTEHELPSTSVEIEGSELPVATQETISSDNRQDQHINSETSVQVVPVQHSDEPYKYFIGPELVPDADNPAVEILAHKAEGKEPED